MNVYLTFYWILSNFCFRSIQKRKMTKSRKALKNEHFSIQLKCSLLEKFGKSWHFLSLTVDFEYFDEFFPLQFSFALCMLSLPVVSQHIFITEPFCWLLFFKFFFFTEFFTRSFRPNTINIYISSLSARWLMAFFGHFAFTQPSFLLLPKVQISSSWSVRFIRLSFFFSTLSFFCSAFLLSLCQDILSVLLLINFFIIFQTNIYMVWINTRRHFVSCVIG